MLEKGGTCLKMSTAEATAMLGCSLSRWHRDLVFRTPDGSLFGVHLAHDRFRTTGGWGAVCDHMQLRGCSGAVGLSTADGRVVDVTRLPATVTPAAAAPVAQPQRRPQRRRGCNIGATARGGARVRDAAGNIGLDGGSGDDFPGNRSGGEGDSGDGGEGDSGDGGDGCAPAGSTSGSDFASEYSDGDGDGEHGASFYLEMGSADGLKLPTRMLRELFDTRSQWPLALRVTLPPPVGRLPQTTDLYKNIGAVRKPDWEQLRAALEQQAGRKLRRGSVLYIARLPARGRNALYMRLVTGRELTPAVRRQAATTASAEWAFGIDGEPGSPNSSGGGGVGRGGRAVKRRAASAFGGSGGGAGAAKRRAADQTGRGAGPATHATREPDTAAAAAVGMQTSVQQQAAVQQQQQQPQALAPQPAPMQQASQPAALGAMPPQQPRTPQQQLQLIAAPAVGQQADGGAQPQQPHQQADGGGPSSQPQGSEQVQALYLAAASHASTALHRLMAGGSPEGAPAAAQLQHAKMMAQTAESLAMLVTMASPPQLAGSKQ